MKTKLIILFTALIVQTTVFGGTETFIISTDSEFTGLPASRFLMADGITPAPMNCRVQGLMNTGCSQEQAAPIAKAPLRKKRRHIFGAYTPSNVQEYKFNKTSMGKDSAVYGFDSPLKSGEVTMNIGISGNGDWYGWLRAFSSVTITGSAYYADTPPEKLNTNTDENGGYGNLIINNINPAYIIPDFDYGPFILSGNIITGSIPTTILGSNNQLKNDDVVIEYSFDKGKVWNQLKSSISGAGDFFFACPQNKNIQAANNFLSSPKTKNKIYLRIRYAKSEFPHSRTFLIASKRPYTDRFENHKPIHKKNTEISKHKDKVLPELEKVSILHNDNFNDAEFLASKSGTLATVNTSATCESDEPSHNPFASKSSHSLWWKFTPSAKGCFAVNLSDSDFSAVIKIYSGTSFADLEETAWGTKYLQTSNLELGKEYYIAIDGFDKDKKGKIKMSWRFSENTIKINNETVSIRETKVEPNSKRVVFRNGTIKSPQLKSSLEEGFMLGLLGFDNPVKLHWNSKKEIWEYEDGRRKIWYRPKDSELYYEYVTDNSSVVPYDPIIYLIKDL